MPGSFSAMVARPVGKREVMETPEAKAALDKELSRLRKKPVWDERPHVVREAKRD